MMMTSTHFNAWLLSIELGTGVVIGQHFQARCAETCERIPNHHQNWRKKRLRERGFIRAFVCTKHTQTLSFTRVFVLSSFVFCFWQLVYGVPLDDWYPSCGLPKVLFTIAYSKRQRQILRLARISLVPNPHNHLPHIFSACACSRRWEGEEEDDDGGRSSTHHSLSARGTHTQYIFSVKKSFVLTRLRLLIDAEQHKITIFRLRNYIYICLCVCAVMCVNEREFTSRLFVIIFDSKLLVRVRFFVPIWNSPKII